MEYRTVVTFRKNNILEFLNQWSSLLEQAYYLSKHEELVEIFRTRVRSRCTA